MTEAYKYVFEKKKQGIISSGQGIEEKYNRAGVYSISIGNELVYIGKSENMLKRLTEHVMEIEREIPKEHKYKVLKEARENHLPIKFDVLYCADNSDHYKIIEEIGEKEGELIRENLPPLNYQIPKAENYKSFTVNQTAATISLEEILKQEN